MKIRKICSECGSVTYVDTPEVDIKFGHCNLIFTAKARRHDDAFYEILNGRFTGNFVHIWDIIK